MNYLAIDTSGKYLTVIACKNGQRKAIFEADGALQHSVRLMDAADEALRAVALTPAECDFFCAVTGPGSFTGIRIGISAVKGFCEGTGKPALGRTSFEVLAYNAEGKALAAVPAGRGNYYVCGFEKDKSICFPPSYVGEEQLKELAKTFPVYAYEPVPVAYTQADPAAGLMRAAESAKAEEFGELGAFYLKKSQAEEERLAKKG